MTVILSLAGGDDEELRMVCEVDFGGFTKIRRC